MEKHPIRNGFQGNNRASAVESLRRKQMQAPRNLGACRVMMVICVFHHAETSWGTVTITVSCLLFSTVAWLFALSNIEAWLPNLSL